MAMDLISSKNIFLLMRDTLKLMDKRLMTHGSRTGYILYKMLSCEGGYEKYELADYVMLATLHDIGAYKTDDVNDMLRFEVKKCMPHSIYGYLFMKYLSPMANMSKVILYHHTDYAQMKDVSFEYKDIACYLHLAEMIDIHHSALGDRFDFGLLSKYSGTKYSEKAVKLFSQAQVKYDIFEQIESKKYEEELDELMDYIMFTNEDKRCFMEMLMYCLGLRSKVKVVDSVTSICICEQIADHMDLTEDQCTKLYYGALLHDVGMLAIPLDLLKANRKLTPEEFDIVKKHVAVQEKILTERMNQTIVDIACRHHERMDGSGYPKGLVNLQMTVEDKILQVADMMTGMISKRAYREPMSKAQVLEILHNDASRGKISMEIVDVLAADYEEIVADVYKHSEEILTMHSKLQSQLEHVNAMFQKKAGK